MDERANSLDADERPVSAPRLRVAEAVLHQLDDSIEVESVPVDIFDRSAFFAYGGSLVGGRDLGKGGIVRVDLGEEVLDGFDLFHLGGVGRGGDDCHRDAVLDHCDCGWLLLFLLRVLFCFVWFKI